MRVINNNNIYLRKKYSDYNEIIYLVSKSKSQQKRFFKYYNTDI